MINRKLLLLIFFIFYSLNSTSYLRAIENKIIAMVDNEPITSYELKNKIITSLVLANQNIDQETINKSKKAAMNSLINIKLKKIETERNNIKADDSNVNSTLKKIASNDINLFKNKFSDNSINFQIFLEEIKVEMAWQKLIYSKYRDKVKVEDSIITNDLEILLKKDTKQLEYKLSEIEIEITKQNKNNKISEVMNEINLQGFEKTAKKLSVSTTAINDGNLGWINSKALSQKMRQILSEMKINEVTEPITKLNIVSFFKITGKRNLKTNVQNIDSVKKKNADQKLNELYKLYSNNYLSKIRNNSFINLK